jgi:hypothetical protein
LGRLKSIRIAPKTRFLKHWTISGKSTTIRTCTPC